MPSDGAFEDVADADGNCELLAVSVDVPEAVAVAGADADALSVCDHEGGSLGPGGSDADGEPVAWGVATAVLLALGDAVSVRERVVEADASAAALAVPVVESEGREVLLGDARALPLRLELAVPLLTADALEAVEPVAVVLTDAVETAVAGAVVYAERVAVQADDRDADMEPRTALGVTDARELADGEDDAVRVAVPSIVELAVFVATEDDVGEPVAAAEALRAGLGDGVSDALAVALADASSVREDEGTPVDELVARLDDEAESESEDVCDDEREPEGEVEGRELVLGEAPAEALREARGVAESEGAAEELAIAEWDALGERDARGEADPNAVAEPRAVPDTDA